MGTGTDKIRVERIYTFKNATGKPFYVIRTCPCCNGEKYSGTRAPCSRCYDTGLIKEEYQ